jgi:microcystin-dependent protein
MTTRLRVDEILANSAAEFKVDDDLHVTGSLEVDGNFTINGTTTIDGAVTITSGSITGITDLAVADGGTGASTAGDARTNLSVYSQAQVDAAIAAAVAALFTTGDVKVTFKTTADTGWVLMNDGTIGNAASGGTTRANADTASLFALLWNNTLDANCAVSGGRGANAAADYAANKTIALPKALGRDLAISGAGSGLTSRALASVLGAETKALIEANLPAHAHSVPGLSVPSLSVTGTLTSLGIRTDSVNAGPSTLWSISTTTNLADTTTTAIVASGPVSGSTGTGTTGTGTSGNGSGTATAVDIMNPRFHANVMIKL